MNTPTPTTLTDMPEPPEPLGPDDFDAIDTGLLQILSASLIGAAFLFAAEGQELALRGLLARHHRRHSGVARARRQQRNP